MQREESILLYACLALPARITSLRIFEDIRSFPDHARPLSLTVTQTETGTDKHWSIMENNLLICLEALRKALWGQENLRSSLFYNVALTAND